MDDILWLENIGRSDISTAGGKGAQLGELKKAGFNVPDGFVITTRAYQEFAKGLKNTILSNLSGLDVENTEKLEKTSDRIQKLIVSTAMPIEIEEDILEAYRKLGDPVAVRSSATAEDLPSASFAGQQETYLNIRGEAALLEACKNCFASLFTNRAIVYRTEKKFDHFSVSQIGRAHV